MNPIETAPHFTPVTVRGEEDQKTTAVYLNDDTPGWYVPGKIYERLEWEPVEWCPAPSGEACSHCHDTHEVDSGGVTPWGEPINVECPYCTVPSDACPDCDGSGWVSQSSYGRLPEFPEDVPCETCEGTGTASRAEI